MLQSHPKMTQFFKFDKEMAELFSLKNGPLSETQFIAIT